MSEPISAGLKKGITHFDLMRHGEPLGGRLYRGDRIDDPLSDLGWVQMRDRVEHCRQAGQDDWTAIISSPLSRCRAFAEDLAAARNLPVHIDPNLREIGFGVWEGLAHAEVPHVYPEQYRAFRADPVDGRPEGAEDMTAFFNRVSGALGRWADTLAGQRVLVIGHAVVMRAALVWATDAPLRSITQIDTEYASLLSLRWRDSVAQRPRVIGLQNHLGSVQPVPLPPSVPLA